MFFSASLSLLTDARPQRKKTWWYAFTAAKAGGDSNAGRDGEATGASSAVFVLLSLLRCGWRQQRGTRRGVTGAYSVIF